MRHRKFFVLVVVLVLLRAFNAPAFVEAIANAEDPALLIDELVGILPGPKESLTTGERTVALAASVGWRIACGGIVGFFDSCEQTPTTVMQAIEAMDRTGASAQAGLLRKALVLFPGNQPPADSKEYRAALRKLTPEQEAFMEPLFDDFLRNGRDYYCRIQEYIATHAIEFPGHLRTSADLGSSGWQPRPPTATLEGPFAEVLVFDIHNKLGLPRAAVTPFARMEEDLIQGNELGAFRMLQQLEKRLGVPIPASDLEGVESVHQLIDLWHYLDLRRPR